MPDVVIGLGGVLVLVAAALLQWKSRSRRTVVIAGLVEQAGGAVVALFLIKPLVPGTVLAVVLLVGIAVGILLTAVIGGRQGRRKPPG